MANSTEDDVPVVPSFKDTTGREWFLTVTIGDSMRLKKDLGVDVNRMISGGDEALQEMFSDSWKLIEILVLLLSDQLEARGLVELVTDKKLKPGKTGDDPTDFIEKTIKIVSDDFYNSLTGDVLDHAAMAFLEAVVYSLPKLKRPALMTIIKRLPTLISTAADQMATKAATMDFEATITEAMKSP